MSVTTIYAFDNPLEYTYDPTLVDIVGGVAKLKLISDPNKNFPLSFASDVGFTYDPVKAEFVGGSARQKLNAIIENYVQPFTSDAGFTYDSAKAEFTGGVCRSKDQRPLNATCGATYTNDINLNWGNGTLTGTAVGGASVSGGKLDLTGGGRYLRYSATTNASSLQEGCVRFRFTPNYSGVPATDMALFSISTSFGDFSCYVGLRHTLAAQIEMSVLNNAGLAVVSVYLGGWLPTSGVEYEFEMNWNITAGATRLFINGVQFGATQAGTGTRTGTIGSLVVGAYYTGGSATNGKFDDIEIFSTVQHTSGYSVGYSVPENIYLESVAIAPIQNYGYNIVSLDVPTIIETNAPHYVVNGYYWNGSTWVASSNTYATAMTYAQWVTNIATFPSGQLSTGVTVKTIFQSSSVLSSIDNISFTMNENHYVETSVTTPELEYTGAGTLVSFDTFTTTEVGSPRYSLQIGRSGDYLYWSGIAWVVSNGTYAQANDKATFQAHVATLDVLGEVYGQFKIHFTDSNTISSISALEATLTGQEYSGANPTVSPVGAFLTPLLINFTPAVSISGSDNIKYILTRNTYPFYWSGTAWVASAGTYTQSNTSAEIVAHIATFVDDNTAIGIKIFLHSATGITTPSISNLVVEYTFGGEVADTIEKCSVWGYQKNDLGVPDLTPFTIQLNSDTIKYKTNTLLRRVVHSIIPDDVGYFEVDLIETTSMPVGSGYIIKYSNNDYATKKIPNVSSKNILLLEDV